MEFEFPFLTIFYYGNWDVQGAIKCSLCFPIQKRAAQGLRCFYLLCKAREELDAEMQIREKCFSLSTTTLHKLHLATGLLLFLSATLDKVILTRRSQGKLVEKKL